MISALLVSQSVSLELVDLNPINIIRILLYVKFMYTVGINEVYNVIILSNIYIFVSSEIFLVQCLLFIPLHYITIIKYNGTNFLKINGTLILIYSMYE